LAEDRGTEGIEDLCAIAEAADAARADEARLREAVQVARARGRSWNQIAVALGVSRQAARQRFAAKQHAGARTTPSEQHASSTNANPIRHLSGIADCADLVIVPTWHPIACDIRAFAIERPHNLAVRAGTCSAGSKDGGADVLSATKGATVRAVSRIATYVGEFDSRAVGRAVES
jgi:hypothetical protein